MIPERAQVILDFWFKETPSEMRFKKDEKFDQKIKDNFLKDYELACQNEYCLLYTSPSPRDATLSRMPSSA